MSVNTSKWLKFFCDAGLPLSVATNYAIIFTNHRIQNDMLCDLTKEILYDMGIKTMGDVIAILRHAKSVDHKTTRDQLLGSDQQISGSANTDQSSTGSRPTLPTNNGQTTRPLAHRFKTNSSAKVSPQYSSSAPTVVSLKRSAQTSGLVKSTNPKIRRIVISDEDQSEGIRQINLNNGSHSRLAIESLKSTTSSPKTSVFSRLGVETNSDKNSSIFQRLGNASAFDSVNPKRRVTLSGAGINTSLDNKNIIKLNNNYNKSNIRSNNLLIRKTVTNCEIKKPILPPNTTGTGGMRAFQTETIGVKNRIGINTISKFNTIPTNNRLIVNRSLVSNQSSAVAQAKRIAMRRSVDMSVKNKTISLRKNIFDRLGPISL